MRLGISATSWMRPNIFRNRLRPSEEVCCTIGSSHARRDGSPESPQVRLRGFWPSVTDNDGLLCARADSGTIMWDPPGYISTRLFQLDRRACGFELLLDLLGFVLVHAFLDRLRRALDQVLGLLQAEAGDRTYLFDHVDLLGTCGGQNDVEFGLLLGNFRRSCARAGSHHGHRSRGGDAPFLLEHLGEVCRFQHG